MGWQAGRDDGAGAESGPGSGLPESPGGGPRDARLAGFTGGGAWDACPPSAELAAALQGASGPEWRCPGASRDELTGLLRQWQALESWAAAGKLGVLRALIRGDDQPLPGGGYRGDLPEGWTKSLTHEVALALAMPAVSAERLMWLAWNLQGLLPGTGDLLAAGQLTLAKARAVDTALNLLAPEDAAKAEALIIAELPGKTYGQVQQLAVQAALTVDPDAGTRRRQDAERHKSRVTLFREETGAAGLSGRDLPTDQALAAHASVCARAQAYKDSGAFPDEARMDQYRAAAYLDLLNGVPAHVRIATGQLATVDRTVGPDAGADDEPDADANVPAQASSDCDQACAGRPGCGCSAGGGPFPAAKDGSDPGDGGDPGEQGGGPGGGSPGDRTPGSAEGGRPGPGQPPRLTDLVLPLATLLGRAERPGEGHGLGPLDPALCRELAAAAAGSPWTRLCVTVTDGAGVAIGHGCAKPDRKSKAREAGHGAPERQGAGPPAGAALALPARLNLTIAASQLAELAATGPPGRAPWSLTRDHDPGPPGGFGRWTLTLPGGRQLTVLLEPVPTLDCDHRHESHAYQPGDRLRHLVQVRDYECTFPTCSRHARACDFEHGKPYHKGGRTCGCNAGARSRACHRVKQSSGWAVTQPRPGWHQWETPSGRRYTQGPKRYPT